MGLLTINSTSKWPGHLDLYPSLFIAMSMKLSMISRENVEQVELINLSLRRIVLNPGRVADLTIAILGNISPC